MEEIVRAVTENPLVAIAVGLSAVLLIYLLFKSLVKLALILILVAVVIYGYAYLRHPESRPASLKEAAEQVRVEAGKAVDQGKSAYEKSKGLVEKGKDVIEQGREWVDRGKAALDQGVEKGKDALTKGMESAPDPGKTPRGERGAGNRQNL